MYTKETLVALSVDQPAPHNEKEKKRIKATEERRGGEEGAQGCMVENFKGEHRVHTDIRLRQQSRAHTDATKGREARTENIHITYRQRRGRSCQYCQQ